MKKIKIKFVDFWMDNKGANRFIDWLKKYYLIEISENPDILIYSVFGNKNRNYTCKKIFFTWENYPHFREINFDGYDYAISHYKINDDRHFWLPSWGWKLMTVDVIRTKALSRLDENKAREEYRRKTKFCCFVVSNPHCQVRNDFFKKLSSIKFVNSSGKHLNNTGYFAPREWMEYMEWLGDFKFSISFENSSKDGYSTEKAFWPLLFDVIPIYWGDPTLGEYFNEKRFLSLNDFKNENDLIEAIIEIDNNEEDYVNRITQHKFMSESIIEQFKEENLVNWFDKILTT